MPIYARGHHGLLGVGRGHNAGNVTNSQQSKTALSRDLGACVYFIRTDDDLIKIGFTTDIANRKRAFGSGWTRILALVGDSTMADEQAMHVRFAAHLERGREYFRPAPELITYINEIRARMGISPIAA